MQPFDLGRGLLSGGDHFGRAFDADDNGVRPSFLDQFGDVAGAGAEVGNAADREIRNAHQEIDRGPQSDARKISDIAADSIPSFFLLPLNGGSGNTLAGAGRPNPS